MPLVGVYLSDNVVGGLIAMWKGGGLAREDLYVRWPIIFTASGEIYWVRRLMGALYIMKGSNGELVFGLAFGGYLLCGGDY